jgi:LysM repeat protein
MRTKNTQFSGLFLVLVILISSVLVPAASAAGSAAPPPPGGKHVVRAGDTLWDVANKYGLTVAQLTAANPGVSPDTLHVGQTLAIPSKTSPVPSAASTGAIYTVKPNDTLWDIASRHGLFVNDLISANPGVDPQRLMAGQTLLIPGVNAKAIRASEPVAAKYTVRADDTLWDIAANYGLSVNDVLAANPGVDPRRLMVGQSLTIPGISQQVLATMLNAPPPPAEAAPIPVVEAPPVDPNAPPPADPNAQPPADPNAPPPADPAAAPAPEQPPAPPPAPEINPMALDMFNKINEKRAAAGRHLLVWNAQIAAAAQAHADDCAARNRGSHVGSDGSRLVNRLQRIGYPYVWHGENWANARSVDRAMEMWWNEPPGADPHVQNILAGRATEIGIGVALGAWGYYFIADFGSR